MSTTEGQNKPVGDYLNSALEKIERLKEEQKDIGDDIKAVFAEAKAKGYNTKVMRRLLKYRAMKPSDRDDEDAILDIYLDVTGMARQPSLFRAAGMMAVDIAAREQVLDAFRKFVPVKGDVIIRFDGAPVRLWRDQDGEVHVEDWKEPENLDILPPEKKGRKRPGPSAPVPALNEDEARALGAQAFRIDKPITSNPFPPADKRRREWDRGWRDASGSDGMGGGR